MEARFTYCSYAVYRAAGQSDVLAPPDGGVCEAVDYGMLCRLSARRETG
jgi:hypothetical protein